MFRIPGILGKCVFGCGSALVLCIPCGAVRAAGSETVLYSFQGGSDGANPFAGLIADAAENLYGTTAYGGSGSCSVEHQPPGCGTVFKVALDGSETVLHSFAGENDGALPYAGLIADQAGNLYGTTTMGGGGSCSSTYEPPGCGTVFKVAPNGSERVLYSFCAPKNCRDGSYPQAGLIADEKGNLYGTTVSGGGEGCNVDGCGVVFKLARNGVETVLHAFKGGSDGANPDAGLIMDSSGDLYGTTYAGGASTNCENFLESGCGTVFKLAPDGTETVLYSFCSQYNGETCTDGNFPAAGLVMDDKGNLYGTTQIGGEGCYYGCGIVFKLAPDGTETVLYALQGWNDGDGAYPIGGLILGKGGNLYGTTLQGGGKGCPGMEGCGIVFKVAPDGTEIVLYSFEPGNTDGHSPYGSLILQKGNLYGTTGYGGGAGCIDHYGCGTVFQLQE